MEARSEFFDLCTNTTTKIANEKNEKNEKNEPNWPSWTKDYAYSTVLRVAGDMNTILKYISEHPNIVSLRRRYCPLLCISKKPNEVQQVIIGHLICADSYNEEQVANFPLFPGTLAPYDKNETALPRCGTRFLYQAEVLRSMLSPEKVLDLGQNYKHIFVEHDKIEERGGPVLYREGVVYEPKLKVRGSVKLVLALVLSYPFHLLNQSNGHHQQKWEEMKQHRIVALAQSKTHPYHYMTAREMDLYASLFADESN